MDLGLDNLRKLLATFLGNTGGRRGREREQARQDARDEQATAEGATDLGDDPAAGGQGQSQDQDQEQADPEAAETGAQQNTTFDREERPDPDELDEDEVVDDLYYRIESLEDELESNGAQLGTIQDSQQHVAEKVDDVDDTIRQLLGVYDRLTNDVNPFTGDGEEEGGFGIFGQDTGEGFGLETDDEDEETVSFADLKSVIEEAAEASADAQASDDESTGQKITFDEEAYIDGDEDAAEDRDTRVEVQATERVDGDEADGEADEPGDDVTLDTLASTYATDVLVFEWLAELVRTAGPAATLRAISYYDEIGWIDSEVREHLERVLSGPDLDIHVDPTATPDELTAEDHADSYTYIMKLNEIHETRREVES